MKLAVSGKGGVGKTTLSAMLASLLALEGGKVIAIDADPDANLGAALGVPPGEEVTPLADMREMIEERTEARKGYGGYFKLNPKVDDIPEAYARHIGNIRLLALGGVSAGGDGCICPASALLKALLVHLVLGRDEHLIMDMEAGIEHLGRATAQSMDGLAVVVNPDRWSIQTAHRIRKLAGDLGMTRVFAVANRVRRDADLDVLRAELDAIPLIGRLPVDDRLAEGIVRVNEAGALDLSEAFRDHMPELEEMRRQLTARL